MCGLCCLHVGPPLEAGARVELDEGEERELAGLVVDRPDGVAGEGLVDHHAVDAHHRGAPVVPLGVQLELLDGRVRVAHPRNAVPDDITRLTVRVLPTKKLNYTPDRFHASRSL